MVAKWESIANHAQYRIFTPDMTMPNSPSVVTNDFVDVTDKRSGSSQVRS